MTIKTGIKKKQEIKAIEHPTTKGKVNMIRINKNNTKKRSYNYVRKCHRCGEWFRTTCRKGKICDKCYKGNGRK